MEKTCRLVHITYRENNRDPRQEEYKARNLALCVSGGGFFFFGENYIIVFPYNHDRVSNDSVIGQYGEI